MQEKTLDIIAKEVYNMSILGFLFKSKKSMAKPYTKEVKVGKYTLTKHAQNRIAEPKKDLSKHNVLRNLFGTSDVTKLYNYHGESQYDRIHRKTKIVTHISPEHKVKTIHKVHKPLKEIEKRRKEGVLIERNKRR